MICTLNSLVSNFANVGKNFDWVSDQRGKFQRTLKLFLLLEADLSVCMWCVIWKVFCLVHHVYCLIQTFGPIPFCQKTSKQKSSFTSTKVDS